MKQISTAQICTKVTHRHVGWTHARRCLEWSTTLRNDDPHLVSSIEALIDADMPFKMFTFGISQRHPVTGENIGKRCTVWRGEGEFPRALQFQRFGSEWAFDYGPDKALTIIREHSLIPLTPLDLPNIQINPDRDVQKWIDSTIF